MRRTGAEEAVMSRAIRWVGLALAVVVGCAAAAFVVGYLRTSRGEHAVLGTVVDDPSLPQETVGGVKLHVRTLGDPANPVIIVVHGGPGNDSRYLSPLGALADRYFVVFYDQRGSGLSERVGDDRLGLEDFYGELDAIVERFGRGRPVRLIGHSWGAMLASGYLGRHPQKIEKVVLAEPGMLTPETAAALMDATNDMRPPVTLEVGLAAARIWLASLHVRGPDADARRDWFMSALMSAGVEGNPTAGYYCGGDPASAGPFEEWRFGARVAPALFREARRDDGSWDVDFVRGVERFEGKVLFLAGSCNTIIGEAQQRRHMRSFPNAELIVIEGSGHRMFSEKPDESLAAVRRYFEDGQSPKRWPTPAVPSGARVDIR
jgi:proline iminopeptidase